MKKTHSILIFSWLLCAILCSCGKSYQNGIISKIGSYQISPDVRLTIAKSATGLTYAIERIYHTDSGTTDATTKDDLKANKESDIAIFWDKPSETLWGITPTFIFAQSERVMTYYDPIKYQYKLPQELKDWKKRHAQQGAAANP